jgi:hypothetical protein
MASWASTGSITSCCITGFWISTPTYRNFRGVTSNRDPKRLPVLARCLARANLTSSIDGIQSLPSHEVVLIQLCDLFIGAAILRMP